MLKKIVTGVMVSAVAFVAIADETIASMPSAYKASIEWVYNQRISPKSSSAPIGEGSLERLNNFFDQIYAENGALYYVGRWQSSQKLTLANRQALEKVLNTKVNNWASLLKGYDGWPYGTIPVKIVGWAVADASVIQDKQSTEVVYTTYETDPVNATDATIPAKLPYANTACWRFEHFSESNYNYASCPGGSANHFDMYLWATSNWLGGCGGDWGQRMSESAWLSGSFMIDHEMGHGFGITDFYETAERPTDMESGAIKTIMWAGNASAVTDWDKWMLRYMWTKLKANTTRFPARTPVVSEGNNIVAAHNVSQCKVMPKQGKIQISTANGIKGNVVLQLFDMKGAKVDVRQVRLNETTVLLEGKLNRINNGCYLVKISGNTFNEVYNVNLLN